MGHVDYALFSMPEILFKAYPALLSSDSFTSMLATSLVFNPLLFIPVNILYGAFFYLRDKVGFANFAKSIFNGRIAQYAKRTYKNVRSNLWSDTKNVFKYMFPLHFFQTHYLPRIAQSVPYLSQLPPAALRMTQSALLNNPLYRLIMSTKKKEEKAYKSPYASGYAPAYA